MYYLSEDQAIGVRHCHSCQCKIRPKEKHFSRGWVNHRGGSERLNYCLRCGIRIMIEEKKEITEVLSKYRIYRKEDGNKQ